MVAFGRLVVVIAGGTIIVNVAVATPLTALPLKAFALNVTEFVSAIAVFAYAVEVIVGSAPSVV